MNYTATKKDARAKTVTTNIDANKGPLLSVTDPNNQTVSYAYDSLKRMTSVSTTADKNLPYSDTKVEDVDTDSEDHAYDALRMVLMAYPAPQRDVRTYPPHPELDPLNQFGDKHG